MSFRAFLVLGLMFFLGPFPLVHGQTKRPADTPRVQITGKPLPTVKEAIAQAIDHTKAYQLFLNESVEITATKEPDGTVKVLFSRPTSRGIAAEGRKPVKPIVEVWFTENDIPATQPEQKGPAVLQEWADALGKAVRAVCSERAEADKMEFAVSASQDDDGFSVLVERIPYQPGGHATYKVSSAFEVVRVYGGK